MPEFNQFLHDLRGEELRRMPVGAKTFLSAGCSGSWYFRWIAERYPGITSHIGVEAYSDKPDDLPPEARWIANTVANMNAVQDSTVDLVFSGQNIEHLTEADVAGFLCEAKRVLRPGGWLVMDSPNRAITECIGWIQPEHMIEFRVDEIVELVTLAGFDVDSVRGLWQCYDRKRHVPLALEPTDNEVQNQQRIDAGRDDPENAFVWWLTAQSASRSAQRDRIEAKLAKISAAVFPRLQGRFVSQVGTIRHAPLMAEATSPKGVAGYTLYGPYTPLFPGTYRAVFRLRAQGASGFMSKLSDTKVADVDIMEFSRDRIYGVREVRVSDLDKPDSDGFCDVVLQFTLDDAAFGVEFRVFSTGASELTVKIPVQLSMVNNS